MSFGSFFAGLSGLQANSTRLQVVGNNLANLNTVGFKAGRANFQDIFTGFTGVNGAGNPQQIGRGTQIATIDSVFSQGSLQSTSLLTDISIQGRGFFVLANQTGGQSYTRDGNFSFDASGNLVSSTGRFVQGYTQQDANGVVATSGTLSNIRVPTGLTAPPRATTEFNATINLSAAHAEPFTTSVTVVDSLGDRHDVTVTFTPTANAREWDFEVTVPGAEVTGGTAGTPSIVGTGTISFDADGNLNPVANPTVNIPGWTNGAAAQAIDWSLFDADGNGLLTQFSEQSAISASNQDGYGVGTLQTLIIDQDGLISGIFTNGANLQIARLALANFNNENGLVRDGASTFLATTVAGSATVGAANTGGRGATVSNSLELSNVDITQEFTEMIISQRGYQANSRIITTTDEIIQEALSLKR